MTLHHSMCGKPTDQAALSSDTVVHGSGATQMCDRPEASHFCHRGEVIDSACWLPHGEHSCRRLLSTLQEVVSQKTRLSQPCMWVASRQTFVSISCLGKTAPVEAVGLAPWRKLLTARKWMAPLGCNSCMSCMPPHGSRLFSLIVECADTARNS